MQKPERVYLKQSAMSNPYELFHKFAENFLFFKWTFFKNRPRSSFLLVRSVFINSVIFGGYYYLFSHINFLMMGVDVNPVLLYTAAVFMGYWSMTNSFNQKCNYLSNMYNEIIKYEAGDVTTTSKVLRLNFCAQLLTMDLWGHRLYSWLFVKTLFEAELWAQENNKSNYASIEEFHTTLVKKNLKISEVRNKLINYQRFLIEGKDVKKASHLKVA